MNKEPNIVKNIITVLLALLILGLGAGTASATQAVPGSDTGLNVTISATSATGIPASLITTSGASITVYFNNTNASATTWNINATNQNVSINGSGSPNGTITANGTFTLNSSVPTDFFNVTVSNADNVSENATLTGFWFVVPVDLGTADTFGILAHAYTNTNPTTIIGDLGYYSSGSTMPTVTGTIHVNDATYNQSGSDQANASTALNSQPCTFTFPADVNLGTDTSHGTIGVYTPGVYCITGAATTGTGITLNGAGRYIFRVGTTLNTVASTTSVALVNGASASDVFWTPTGATTLGATSTFNGTVIEAASAAITVGAGTNWTGRALNFNGAVTTDTNVITAGPDLSLTSQNIIFVYDASEVTETGEARENINLTINATIYNVGISSSGAFNVLFYDNNSEFHNASMNSISAGGSATATAYWTTLAGTHNITVKVDPAGATSDTDRSNNNASKLINVSAWQKYYGNAVGNYVLANNLSTSMKNWTWNNETNIGYLYVVNHSASINWSHLHPLGYDKNNASNSSGQDFQDADTNLGLVAGTNNATGFQNNNITELFTNTGSNYGNVAINTTTFVIFGNTINNVSVVNSTDMTNHNSVGSAYFITGILWDDTKDTNGYYDTSDKEDLVFITTIRPASSGLKGTAHNYEIAVPYSLNSIMGGDVDMYMELK